MSNNDIIDQELDNTTEQEQNNPSQGNAILDQFKQWLNQQNKPLVYAVAAMLILSIVYFSYQYLYKIPREKEGLEAIYQTQGHFDTDSFRLVVKTAPKLADQYNGTRAGNLAAYMAGASYLRLSDYKKAITYLEQCSFEDHVMKYQAIGLLGDAYIEDKNLDKGLDLYLKASKGADIEFSKVQWALKAATVYEKKNEWQAALDIYFDLKKNYKENDAVQEMDKFIGRAKAKLGEY
jgi:hypothetical protein